MTDYDELAAYWPDMAALPDGEDVFAQYGRPCGEVVVSEYDLILGDCLEAMKDIPDGSINAVIADPPYVTTACTWDSVIPLPDMWSQLKRLIKPNGAIVLFASQPFTSALVMSNLEWFRYSWVWDK